MNKAGVIADETSEEHLKIIVLDQSTSRDMTTFMTVMLLRLS
jgi:hypothetical protein